MQATSSCHFSLPSVLYKLLIFFMNRTNNVKMWNITDIHSLKMVVGGSVRVSWRNVRKTAIPLSTRTEGVLHCRGLQSSTPRVLNFYFRIVDTSALHYQVTRQLTALYELVQPIEVQVRLKSSNHHKSARPSKSVIRRVLGKTLHTSTFQSPSAHGARAEKLVLGARPNIMWHRSQHAVFDAHCIAVTNSTDSRTSRLPSCSMAHDLAHPLVRATRPR